jgi:hypothetical protein
VKRRTATQLNVLFNPYITDNLMQQFFASSKNSADVLALMDALDRLPQDAMLSYDDLNAVVGRDVKTAHRYLLISACDRLLKHKQKAFGAVTSKGIKRLTDTEAISQCASTLNKVRRIAKKAATKAATVNFSALNDDEKRRHNGYISQMAAIIYTADSSHINRITGACQNNSPFALPTAQTLRLLAS